MERRHSPACARNTQPIGDQLARLLPQRGVVLEIGAGTGEHAVAFARRFSTVTWQPVDRPGHLDSIEAWRREADLPNLRPALAFDLFAPHPPVPAADAVFCANVLHIAPPEATAALFRHAAALLPHGATLIVYGPFRYRDRPLEPSNAAFDLSLRSRDPQMGLRYAEDVDAAAGAHGLALGEDIAMPANNRLRWWSRTA